MSLFGLIRQDIKKEKVEIKTLEKKKFNIKINATQSREEIFTKY